MQDSGAAGAEARRSAGLDTDEAHGVGEEAGEEADRVRAAADARDGDFRQQAVCLDDLLPRLSPDHGLQLSHDLGVRLRADARADQVMGRLDRADPVADRLARRLLERLRAELDRPDFGSEQAHSLDVRPLAAHVLGAHVDDALEPEARADGRGRDAVLAGAGLRDDPTLAESLRQQRLAERVVELVCASVEQVLALEVEPLARREALRERERRRPARVRPSEPVELLVEGRVLLRLAPAGLELVERRNQRLRDESAAVLAIRQLHRVPLPAPAKPALPLSRGSVEPTPRTSSTYARTRP